MQLLFATTNQGKLAEAQQILTDFQLLSLVDFPQLKDMDVDETGATFAENSELKAKAYGLPASVLTVAEDAGLIVDDLNGEPGVWSARYAADDNARNQKILASLNQVAKSTAQPISRKAHFVSDLCLFDPNTGSVKHFLGQVDGKIALSVRGQGGFGYDPIFIPTGYEQTFGELGADVKNRLSHRSRALQQLSEYLAG